MTFRYSFRFNIFRYRTLRFLFFRFYQICFIGNFLYFDFVESWCFARTSACCVKILFLRSLWFFVKILRFCYFSQFIKKIMVPWNNIWLKIMMMLMYLITRIFTIQLVTLLIKQNIGILTGFPCQIDIGANRFDNIIIISIPYSSFLIFDIRIVVATIAIISFMNNQRIQSINMIQFFIYWFISEYFCLFNDKYSASIWISSSKLSGFWSFFP